MYEVHPAAEIFPMLDDTAHAELREDIRDNGLRQPITLFAGKILDGRNRAKACAELKIEPRFEYYDGPDPLGYVISLNLRRRHLNESQRGMVRARVEGLRPQGGDRRSEGFKSPNGALKTAVEQLNASDRTTDRARKVLNEGTRELIAACDGGDIAVSLAADLATQDEELQRDVVASVRDGLKPKEAVRRAQAKRIAEGATALPKGKHRVVYADPPWKYNDSKALDGYDSTAAANNYPTMSVAELCALDVKSLAADDAVLFCWATFPLLPDALEVVKAWGFKYKTAFVWAKGRANYGNYHDASAELLLVCTRGKGTPDASKREVQVQSVPHPGRHSAKPEDFRSMIDRLYTSGPRIELFRRGGAPDGWSVWGNEASGETKTDGR